MTGARIVSALDDKEIAGAFGRLNKLVTAPAGLLGAIGTGLVMVTVRRMDRGVDPAGNAWAPLNPAYAEIKRGPGILRASLMLQRSITFEVGPNQVTWGSNRIYAGVHQHGATIVPKQAKALVFRLGGGVVRAKSVMIPARPYLGWDQDEREVTLDVLEGAMARALRA